MATQLNATAYQTEGQFQPAAHAAARLWGTGNYADVGARLQIVGETLCEFAGLRSSEEVLDVAAGNGNFSLAAARRFAHVTCSDIVPQLLAGAQRRARASGLRLRAQLADAEALPFANETFDVSASVFGIMFASDHHQAAGELQRVTRTGGRIALAAWTPKSFIGQLFGIIRRYRPTTRTPSPMLWGTEDYLSELFATAARRSCATAIYTFRYASAAGWVDYFSGVYGPLHATIAQLDRASATALREELVAFVESVSADPATMLVPGEYLQARIQI